eukprot:GHVL01004700.1.p1 GENE.GHVL01004700.1~~GHVL01004700.1.p1  ORF type:complete len:115 (+),score=16.56 GHVL01004700.1:188-532(+)
MYLKLSLRFMINLLIPKAEGYATIMDMSEEMAADVMKELPRLAKAVQAATKCDGINLYQNNGASAGQAVFHVHFHVVPRFNNDNLFSLPGPKDGMISKEDGEKWQVKIKEHLSC